MKKSILFLGSGATAGSGLKKEDSDLPFDGKFFESDIVKKILNKKGNGYPTLNKLRSEKNSLWSSSSGLYQTWQNLLFLRSFLRSGVISDVDNQRLNTLNELKNYTFQDCEGQKEHYLCQFKIFESYGNKIPASEFIELAIWDLRVLVKEVYSDSFESNKDEKYSSFWQKFKATVRVVVNLNYDTTFDDCLTSSPKKNKIKIIRPHGSLKWTYLNRWSLRLGRFIYPAPWPSFKEETKLADMGYRKRGCDDILDFRQPLLIAPDDVKEEIVGSSSLPGLIDSILRCEWQEFYKSASEAKHWIFIGFSLSSGDNHLVFLLKKLFSEKPREIHASCYCHDCCCSNSECKTDNAIKEVFGRETKICIHPLPKGSTIDVFTSHNDCELLKSNGNQLS